MHGCRVDAIEIFSLHSGKRLGELPCRKFGPSLRVLREELLGALLRAVGKKKISVVYDSKLVAIKDESGKKATPVFATGQEVRADFILGCDGVPSAVRTSYVEPDGVSIYTDVAVAYAVVEGKGIDTHFQQTAMNSGRFGSLLTSFVDPETTRIYLGDAMETRGDNDRQGCRVRGNDSRKTMEGIERYKGCALVLMSLWRE